MPRPSKVIADRNRGRETRLVRVHLKILHADWWIETGSLVSGVGVPTFGEYDLTLGGNALSALWFVCVSRVACG